MSGKTKQSDSPKNRRLPSRIGLVFLFTILFIIQKFFIKNQFINESAAIYPFFYLVLLAVDGVRGRDARPLEIWFAVNASWILMVSRFVYIPPTAVLFGITLWRVRRTIWAVWSLLLLALMCVATALARV